MVQAALTGGIASGKSYCLARLAALGVPTIDADKLAETAARLNRYEFMFVVAPLSIPGGTGGPVNPIAVF